MGILTLASGSIVLVIVTGAVVTNLIPLYAIGVFWASPSVRRAWRGASGAPDT
ncbi:MAG: hypothetical protein U0521_07925 [Anaerolineae bacterium]